ncbi:SAM-dependent methyltransferase [Cohnella pontilimi]|uniref:SAM-dependent methyltransferase n=1 Tax=Cohnella pontilimi TaxID=2564100 RepID=A0A4U0FF27_9BACL|nr:class I SAM-dependent methyltransferase [Cohnella pontilimi]TJY43410.1 SAM-dependent methyltransferase [Cohnella pontilimi]
MRNESNAEGAAVKLSRRLSALADWVPQGARFADIGTDHALLPVYLAGDGRIAFAVAGDVNPGPVQAAKRQVGEAGLSGLVSVRQGNGLAVLSPGEVDTVCIAGMGGSLIARLLDEAGDRLEGVQTLVLSPHVAEDAVRKWLRRHGFVLDRELLLEEDGVIYTLMRAVRAKSPAEAEERNAELYEERLLAPCKAHVPADLLYEMGPLLLRSAGEAFRRKWEQEIAKREQIIRQMKQSSAAEAAQKAAEWENSAEEIREVLACLRGEKPLSN